MRGGLGYSVSLGKDAARRRWGRPPAARPTLRRPPPWLAQAQTAGLPGGHGPLPPCGRRSQRVGGRGRRPGARGCPSENQRQHILRSRNESEPRVKCRAGSGCIRSRLPQPRPVAPRPRSGGRRGLRWQKPLRAGGGGRGGSCGRVRGPWLVRGKRTASQCQVTAARGPGCDVGGWFQSAQLEVLPACSWEEARGTGRSLSFFSAVSESFRDWPRVQPGFAKKGCVCFS